MAATRRPTAPAAPPTPARPAGQTLRPLPAGPAGKTPARARPAGLAVGPATGRLARLALRLPLVRRGRALLAVGMVALALTLGSCAGPATQRAGSGTPAPAPEPAPAAEAREAAGGAGGGGAAAEATGAGGAPVAAVEAGIGPGARATEPAGPEPAGPEAGGPFAGATEPAGPKAGTPGGRDFDPAGPRPGVDVPATPPAAPGFEVAGVPRQLTAPGPASPPVRLEIPSIGVATPLLRLGRERDGSMQVPADFARAGWFAEGLPPGEVGPAVIAGHVDSKTGPAVFYRLRQLRPGDTVEVERADGTRLVFVVEQARSYPKATFPTAAVFGPAPWAALRLVTCGGEFDRARGSYRDNLVVFARLARVAR
jgi:hypothetical protein